ncbi:MAG: thioredoxin-disulfide reductase [Candidatus Omnitrophica bacterium]|nr:thioredoxin-disulfide reductase [Candidatus Omnitrophota bacterium]
MAAYDLIIIGAGPAGLTAGLYAGRFRLKALILEKMTVGGQIILSSTIENYPGFPGSIATFELIEKISQQVKEVGINIENAEVLEIIPSKELPIPVYNIKTQDNSYQARSVIIASGAQSRRLGVEGEEKFIGRGVSYCGTCDGPLFKNKDIILVGGGDRAIEEALFLSSYARKVTVVHRRQQLRASKILEEKARLNQKINFLLDSVIEKIIGKDRVEEVQIKNVATGALSTVCCQGVFIFVGISPNTNFLRNLLQIDDSGFIITNQNSQTSLQGIFACGDCLKKSLYQVINACGEGAVAADSAHKYLLNL